MTTKDIKTLALGIAATLIFIALMGWAGRADYQEAVITEMKNNGTYYELAAQHPTATDKQLVEMYTKQHKQ